MSNIFRLLKTFVGNHKVKFIFLNFLTLLSTLADMISLGSLTAFISFIFDKQILIDFLKKYNLEHFSSFFYKENSLILLTVILISVFIIKNLFLFFVHYF